jgi:hypothetical protein
MSNDRELASRLIDGGANPDGSDDAGITIFDDGS